MNLIIPSSGVANTPVNASQVQTISIDRNEALRLNNEAVDADTLATRLAQLKQKNADIAVVIRPDRELPVQKLIALMDALQRAQIMKVGIATRSETK
jgi:biopolymer transport protein ExbD